MNSRLGRPKWLVAVVAALIDRVITFTCYENNPFSSVRVKSHFMSSFHVTLHEAIAPVEYNYRDKAELMQKGETYFTQGESHGLSVFLRDGHSVFHTYSTYARGTDLLVGTTCSLSTVVWTFSDMPDDKKFPAGVSIRTLAVRLIGRQHETTTGPNGGERS
jgi:Bacterial protein of unknown function (DUF899)